MTSDRQRALISMSSLSSFLAYSVTMTNTQKGALTSTPSVASFPRLCYNRKLYAK